MFLKPLQILDSRRKFDESNSEGSVSFLDLPGGSVGKESACSAGDPSSIPGSGREGSLWRREWLPTPVILPGEFHGQRSLVGYGLRGRKEFDTTEGLTQGRTTAQFFEK